MPERQTWRPRGIEDDLVDAVGKLLKLGGPLRAVGGVGIKREAVTITQMEMCSKDVHGAKRVAGS